MGKRVRAYVRIYVRAYVRLRLRLRRYGVHVHDAMLAGNARGTLGPFEHSL